MTYANILHLFCYFSCENIHLFHFISYKLMHLFCHLFHRFSTYFCHFYDYLVSPSSSFVAGNDIPLFPHYSVCYVVILLIFPPKLTFSNECRLKTCLCQKFSVPLRENRADRKKISCYTTLCGFIIGQLRVQIKQSGI